MASFWVILVKPVSEYQAILDSAAAGDD